MNFKVWLKGFAVAAISGAAAGIAQLLSTTGSANKGTGTAASVGALIGVLGYLKQSPVAPSDPVAPPKQ